MAREARGKNGGHKRAFEKKRISVGKEAVDTRLT